MSQNKKKALPTAVERRNLLYGKESRKADHRALGQDYFDAGRMADAAEFFTLANDQDGLDRIQKHALEQGDAFLLAQIERLTGEPCDPDVWREMARRAEQLGKHHFVRQARVKTGDPEPDETADETADENPDENPDVRSAEDVP